MISIFIIPFGRLIYLPIPGFIGLKYSFIFSIFIFLIWVLTQNFKLKSTILLSLPFLSLLSLFYIENYDWILYYDYIEKAGIDAGNITGTTESSLLRVVSIFILTAYSMVVYSALVDNSTRIILSARVFVIATLLSSIIGCIIFSGVFFGLVSINDLEPISVGSPHVIDDIFYRFNPGSNVNEFSMIIAFALFLLYFAHFSKYFTFFISLIFIICEFATLTRSSWIGLLLGFLIPYFYYKKSIFSIRFFLIFFIFLFLFLTFYHSSPFIQNLIDTRTAFDIGVSGSDRLMKFDYVYDSLVASPFRLFFGFGWGTNLYVHNVYLQILYELGLFGLIMTLVSLFTFTRGIFLMRNSRYKPPLVGIFIFIIISFLMQHLLYHIQLWFVIGFIASAAVTFKSTKFYTP
ncbi:MAG: O-antigen ligase family protein [Polynucleobacter sp.]